MAMYAAQMLTDSATGTDENLYLQHLNAFLISELQGLLQVLQAAIISRTSAIRMGHRQNANTSCQMPTMTKKLQKQARTCFTFRGSKGNCLLISLSSLLQFSFKCSNIATNNPSKTSQTCVEKIIITQLLAIATSLNK